MGELMTLKHYMSEASDYSNLTIIELTSHECWTLNHMNYDVDSAVIAREYIYFAAHVEVHHNVTLGA